MDVGYVKGKEVGLYHKPEAETEALKEGSLEGRLDKTSRVLVFSKKYGRKIEIELNDGPRPVGDPRAENVGASPTTWW